MTTMVVEPLDAPPDATIAVPGSKSITNRALVAAALAEGTSVLTGALMADDTEAMLTCLARLGVGIDVDAEAPEVRVTGSGGRLRAEGAELDARLSGTTARFLLPVMALASGPSTIDGAPPLRARPMGPSLDALRALGVTVDEMGDDGRMPVRVHGGTAKGGAVRLSGDISSQFLSGLLLAAPCFPVGLRASVTTPLISRPYVDLTARVMEAFGASVTTSGTTWCVPPARYRATSYAIEPDASAATYLFAAAVLTGGRVTVPGLGQRSGQGDLGFVDVLERMGARVERSDTATTVTAGPALHGIDVDLGDLSDTAQTLAVMAPFADGPTRARGIGFIRAKETDRIAAVVTELRRCGIEADETDDGFVVHPGTPRPATVQTYDDHRMAMSFALLGLRIAGIEITDPGCVRKTFPGYWDTLDLLRAPQVSP